MSKIIIAIIIGGIIFISMSVGEAIGKGYILGLLVAREKTAAYTIEILSHDERWRSKLIYKFAKLTIKTEKKN